MSNALPPLHEGHAPITLQQLFREALYAFEEWDTEVTEPIGMFELPFFTAGPDTQTPVVALCYAVSSPGVRASQSIDAMAMIYMGITLVWVLIALQFVSPT